MKYFKSSFFWSFVGLIGAAALGYWNPGTTGGVFRAVFTVLILSILELSISFDNAVVNATVLKKMDQVWQKRFLTWGMLIAVFGMRLIFPLGIVAAIAHISPVAAFDMALFKPADYAHLMHSIHHEVSAFGGAFLMLVALKYFFDHQKEVHWIQFIERPLQKIGRLESIEIGVVIFFLLLLAQFVEPEHTLSVLISGLAGIVVFILVDSIGSFLGDGENFAKDSFFSAQLGMFIYLEVLDASFSFDGVIGAFAITTNLFLIALGLGIGALFVRSLTIYMVEKKTLDQFPYLEHGAFYAIACLAGIMLLNTRLEISEIITGCIGAVFIGFSVYSSMRKAKA